MNKRQSEPSILFLCDYQAPYGGNFIASMMRLDEALDARDIPVRYMFPSGARQREWCARMEQMGKRVGYLPDGGFFIKLRTLLSMLDEQRATILHVHFGYFPLAEVAAILRPKLRLILHIHSDFTGGRAPGRKQRILALCKRLPEQWIGKNRLQKITVGENVNDTETGYIPLHNALCETRFASEQMERGETRAALGIAANETLVLAFGWSPWIKGVDVVAEAVRTLYAAGHTQFVLGVVCGRTYTQEKMRAYLEERTDCTGTEPWLRLLPPVEDVFRYHKAADVMVSASRSETFSYALLEAVCSGKPCVCSDIPGVRWAGAFDTVRFYATEDSTSLSETLLEMDAARTTPEFMARLTDNAACARQRYDIGGWVDGMLGIYGVR